MHALNCDGPDDLGTPSCPGTTTTTHGATTTTQATVLPATLTSTPTTTSSTTTTSTTVAPVVQGETIANVPPRPQAETLPFTGIDPLVPFVGGLALIVGALCTRVQHRRMRGLQPNR